MVRLLLDRGADVNARSNGGGTPLHDAAAAATPELVELLLARGADANALTKDGHTALMYAEEYENAAAATVLRGRAQPISPP
jgi:ankyrin repeat protein